MSFTFVSHHDFISVNPWFERGVIDAIYGTYGKPRFESEVRKQIDAEFPRLFRDHFFHSELYQSVRSKLEQQTTEGIDRVRLATNLQVSALVDNKEALNEIKRQVCRDIEDKYRRFQSGLQEDFQRSEQQRNSRFVALESKLEEVEQRQAYTFFGGLAIGSAAGLAFAILHH